MLWRLLLAAALAAQAGEPASRPRARRASPHIQLRRRLHVNTLIAEPGTAEVEWSHAFGGADVYSMPTTWKFTPEGSHIYWGRTEWSASFDLLSVSRPEGSRATHFGDQVTAAANMVLYDGERLDLALMPQSTFLLRGDRGVRLGATAIARYDVGRNSAGLRTTWTAATAPSPTNPASMLETDAGFGRRLGAAGLWRRFTAYGDAVWDRASSTAGQASLLGGAECELTGRIALDVTGQRFFWAGGQGRYQVVVGVTVNLGVVGRQGKTGGRSP